MIPYWLLFAFFALGALQENKNRAVNVNSSTIILFGGLVIAVMVGLRYKVGADWATYSLIFASTRYMELGQALEIGEPAYQFLNWSVQQLDAGFWLVNLICGAIFAWGLLRFATVQPNPWLAVSIAVPYLVVVVAMGYTRQAVAIGILMAGLAAIHRGAPTLRFTLYVAAAALFHNTAVVVLPLVVFSSERNRLVNALAGLVAAYGFYDSFLTDSLEVYVKNYIEAKYSSQGAAIRVAMNLVPAAVFLFNQDHLGYSDREKRIWFLHSSAAIALLILLLVLPSSTAVDRLALYVLPLQIAVFSRIPRLFRGSQGKFLVILYMAGVLFVWLNFAVHADAWLPYQFYPFA